MAGVAARLDTRLRLEADPRLEAGLDSSTVQYSTVQYSTVQYSTWTAAPWPSCSTPTRTPATGAGAGRAAAAPAARRYSELWENIMRIMLRLLFSDIYLSSLHIPAPAEGVPVLAVRALVPAPPPARGCRKLPDRRSVDTWIYWLLWPCWLCWPY